MIIATRSVALILFPDRFSWLGFSCLLLALRRVSFISHSMSMFAQLVGNSAMLKGWTVKDGSGSWSSSPLFIVKEKADCGRLDFTFLSKLHKGYSYGASTVSQIVMQSIAVQQNAWITDKHFR